MKRTAEYWRDRAKEMRYAASYKLDREHRASLERQAKGYDEMARIVEEKERK